MPDTRPNVLVTEPEYRKGEDCFVAASELECRRTRDDEQELAAADTRCPGPLRDRREPASTREPLYEAMPAGGVIARFGVGHDGIDKARATAAQVLCTNTPGVLDQSVAEHAMLLVAAASRNLTSALGEHGERRVELVGGPRPARQEARGYRVRRHRTRGRAHRHARLRHAASSGAHGRMPLRRRRSIISSS